MSCCFSQSIVDCLQEHHHNLGFAAIFQKYHNHGDVILSGSQIAKGFILIVLYAIDLDRKGLAANFCIFIKTY